MSSPQGRYRIAKWLYRAVVHVTGGQIISEVGLESVDEGWHGRLVVETEGTAEHAKELVGRCAGPAAHAQTRAQLLASIMDKDKDGNGNGNLTPGTTVKSLPAVHASNGAGAGAESQGQKAETTTPWVILRERSRPGLIWLR